MPVAARRNGRQRHRVRLGLIASACLALVWLSPAVARSAGLETIAAFGPNPGELSMHVYRPATVAGKPALVVALHGCRQTASDIDDATGLAAEADRQGFIVLLPEQSEANNSEHCFNWFRREDTSPLAGESGSIRAMIAYMVSHYDVDPERIYVLGLSAGGSMTAVLLANYPDLIEAGAIVAGTPFGCNAPTWRTALPWWTLRLFFGKAAAATYACGLLYFSPTKRLAETWGDFVRTSPSEAPTRWPRVSLWQGSEDKIVDPANLNELMKQWTNVHGTDQVPEWGGTEGRVTRRVFSDSSGTPVVETWVIADLGHAFSVAPDAGCGTVAPFVEDGGICTTRAILRFWGLAEE